MDGNNSLFVLIVGRTRLNDDPKDKDINMIKLSMLFFFSNHDGQFQIHHYHFG